VPRPDAESTQPSDNRSGRRPPPEQAPGTSSPLELFGVGDLIFEQASEAIIVTSADGIVAAWNGAAERLHGIGRSQALGRALDELLAARSMDGSDVGEAVRAALQAGHSLAHRVVQRPLTGTRLGQETIVDTLVSPVTDEAGTLAGSLSVSRDVTSSDRLQQELLQAQKMEAIGLLVAGVAHELNNPLASILAFSQLIRTDKDLPPALHDQADLLIQEARRTHHIVKGLLDFARQQPPERLPTSLRELVDEVLGLQSYSFGPSRIKAIVEIPDDLPEIPLDRAQIEQVLVNLTLNAAQAIRSRSEKGTIRLTAARSTTDAGEDVVRLSITDDGPGIPAELRSRLFVPFFTTKAPGEGTGLGLSVSFGIVAGHGGTLRQEAGPGGVGTTFLIELPIAPSSGPSVPRSATSGEKAPDLPAIGRSDRAEPAVGRPTPARRPVPRPGDAKVDVADDAAATGPRILVLDDEASIRDFLSRILRRNGYEPVAVVDGAAGLEAIHADPPSAILCDHRMAGMSGIAFHEAVQAIDPELARRFAFMSGDVLNPELHDFAVARGIVLLAKPFDIESVTRTIATIIAA
jgi:two-component system NtrC family sensor kinase